MGILLLVESVLSDERIDHSDAREPAEVPVGRPKLAHAVLAAQRRDPSVVNSWTCYDALNKNGTQGSPVSRRLGQQG